MILNKIKIILNNSEREGAIVDDVELYEKIIFHILKPELT